MKSMLRGPRWKAAALAALALMAGEHVAQASNFRIHTKVFAGAEKEPVSENTTIFHDGLVYDFIEKPSEVLVFDPAAGQFVLLDPQRRQWAEITLAQLDVLLPELKQKLAAREDDFAAFLARRAVPAGSWRGRWRDRLSRSLDALPGGASPAPSEAVASQYAAFSSHSTRLGALRRTPLLARVVVNDWLSERQLIPESVRLTTFSKNRAGMTVPDAELRSEHAMKPELTSDDLARIGEAARWRAEFRRVGLTTYWTAAE